MNIRLWLVSGAVLAATAAFATGCATGESTSSAKPRYKPNPGTASCFFSRQVSDFQVLDRRNLLVYAPNKRSPYHVELSPSGGNIRFADALAFQSRDNRICGYGGDSVIFGGGASPSEASIMGVYRLDERGLHQLLVAFGKAEPLEDLEPAESPGAEIEDVTGDNNGD